ncbi:tRNA (adenosine(37)-N6)-threonylcarbamoyltransferase complex transferase subunit TsaD [Celeribacter marinus]|uniref:tRNA N6-adenosine threonylcarbamoyltransferase n=1 Tax=Celeribacter marinus TaxID=1397108 RepID=A0A0N9ZDS8_9RHOB|nr:tRNA (adenosine(37)-N6)-threonylcarbamoyltransferase complex transferase subunit TsaD [Celeribacter marinus]ALI54956.1 tsaD/Kae1/Qri7 protein, required for threonylcarbamoyladenosine t(6)A37 formation in tRNA [Celeribacter marinus]SFK03020.1 O-sialoglycoprotein endopeptidase [Celeribacter marinus]
MSKLILGIETSCDDTSVALVDRSGAVAAIKTVSQYDIHEAFGGVYPELASRAHLHAILPTIQTVMTDAATTHSDLEAIAVTRGPGLIGSLLVGLSTAEALSMGWGVPAYGINHLRGHIRSAALEGGITEFPAVVMLVSGGHTLIAFLENEWSYRLLGTTRDDSVGECYDKVARTLGLGMPGGPAIDRAAARGTPVLRLPRPMKNDAYEFSFSGLKSSVARHVETHPDVSVDDMSASFVAACMDVLAAKAERALKECAPKSLVIVGGVAASAQLRETMSALVERYGVTLSLPPVKWATDNAAMIAMAAWDYVERGVQPDLMPKPNLSLETP